MNFFGSGKQINPEDQARAEASRVSIAQGGLPLNAVDRLTEQAKKNREGKPFFTSDLSPNELLLTRECGFEPVGQVMGSCVYQVGWQYLPQSVWGYSSGELEMMTASQIEARNLAFSRLREEAKLLGADGVVGVRFTFRQGDFGMAALEFMAVGTAVRRIGAPPPASGKQPFVSNLSGQDHWMLRKAGFAPLGFVFGACVWYQYPDWFSANAMMSWSNAELTSLTQGVYTAREVAISRLEAESHLLAASGVVGMYFEDHVEPMAVQAQGQTGARQAFVMHCTAWGTAIGPDPAPSSSTKSIAFNLSLEK